MLQHWRPLFILLVALLAVGCKPRRSEPPELEMGSWRLELDLNDRALPFVFDLLRVDGGRLAIDIHNGDEVIRVDDIELVGDSINIRMPLFDSEFRGLIDGPNGIHGLWYNYLKGPDYRIPFQARYGNDKRFNVSLPSRSDARFDGVWEVHFSPGSADHYPAIGMFRSTREGLATGTFITETGDYRFLEGTVTGDSLFLSCFDGSHAFLFEARMDGDSVLGRFWSGNHWQEPWVARRNPEFRLRDPDSLTYLREGYDMIDFRFPDLEGAPVSPSDPQYKGRPLVIQIMGSWCPNCVDETRLLNELYEKYHGAGLEVISIAFEKYEDPAKAIVALKRFREVLDVRYPILYAGRSSKAVASEKLPFLNHVMSYPTCIIVDHHGRVRRIRTGMYGPGTGAHYLTYKRSFESFLEALLAEARSGKEVG